MNFALINFRDGLWLILNNSLLYDFWGLTAINFVNSTNKNREINSR